MTMASTQTPATPAELAEAVRSLPRVLAVGARTKPRLSHVARDVVLVSTRAMRGIVEYEPSEFTFTALAGTPVREIASALAERGQYLPFDPMWFEAGATLGGTVASGVSGPGRFRFGGVRDFILGVRFVDGLGRLLRMGGKVVKNCAGFDLPKFFVGSLGRFGALAEITFKVFPAPASRLTLKLPTSDTDAACQVLTQAASSRWEIEALDLLPDGKTVCLRLAGPAPALETLAREILARWPGQILPPSEASLAWSDLGEFRWAHAAGVLVKVAITPLSLPPLAAAVSSLDDARVHFSVGGNVAFVSLPSVAQVSALHERLQGLALRGIALKGNGKNGSSLPSEEGRAGESKPGSSGALSAAAAPLWLGARPNRDIDAAVKEALDPRNRFPSLDDQ
jgi:glycolate oxidase FAD binding subunit